MESRNQDDRSTSVDIQVLGILAAILTQLLQSLGLTIQRKAHLRFQYGPSSNAEPLARVEPSEITALFSPRSPDLRKDDPTSHSTSQLTLWQRKVTRICRRLFRLPPKTLPGVSTFSNVRLDPRAIQRHRLITQPLWIGGFVMYLSAGLIGTPFQLSALPILVLAPLGSISLVTNAIFATTILGDPFTRMMLFGTILVFAGTIIVAYFGRIPEQELTLSELLERYTEPRIVAFFTILTFSMVVFLLIIHHAENHPDLLKRWRARFLSVIAKFVQRTLQLQSMVHSASQRQRHSRSFYDDDAQPLMLEIESTDSRSASHQNLSKRISQSPTHRSSHFDENTETDLHHSQTSHLSPLTSPVLPGPFGSLPPIDYGALSDRSNHRRSRSSISGHRDKQKRGGKRASFHGITVQIPLREHECLSPDASSSPTSPFSTRPNGRHNRTTSVTSELVQDDAKDQSRLVLGGSFAVVSGTLSGLVLLFAKTGVEILIYIFDGGADGTTGRWEAAITIFGRWQTWMVIAGIVVPGLTQLIYLSHSLRLASPTLVCPISFIAYTLASISSSLVYSGETGTMNALSWLALMGGLVLTGAGVWIISGTASQPVVRHGQSLVDSEEVVEDDEVIQEEALI